jgi:hypothetical protein
MDSTVGLEFYSNVKTNGVILQCINEVCVILTVAHSCNPMFLRSAVAEDLRARQITSERAAEKLSLYESLLKTKSICSGNLVFDNNNKYISVIPVSIDFDKDLMLLAAHIPGKTSTVGITASQETEPGIEIYTTLTTPATRDKIALFSRAGITQLATAQGDIDKTKFLCLQTYFPVGPGASGAPVFLLDSNLLMGIIDMQIADGDLQMPVGATLALVPDNIKKFLRQFYYMENESDSESNWPYCHGKKYLCEMVLGKTSLLDALRHRRDEKKSNKNTQTSLHNSGSQSRDAGMETAD